MTPNAGSLLLEARRAGPPPFLIRTLRYVRDEKRAARSEPNIFDLNWSSLSYRGAYGQRHLRVTVGASNLVLSPGTARRLEPPTRHNFHQHSSSSRRRAAYLHLTLFIRQVDGHAFCFAYRHSSMRVWLGSSHPDNSQRDELPFNASFDLSSFVPLLTAPMRQISLVAHACAFHENPSTNSTPNEHSSRRSSAAANASAFASGAALIGALVVWERGENTPTGGAVANQAVTIPLGIFHDAVEPGSPELPNCPTVRLGTRPSLKGAAGSIRLRIDGSVENALDVITTVERPHVLVTMRYDNVKHSWDGITRHDFICPWCHINFHRYRALLTHLQFEHDNFKFSVEEVGSPGSNTVNLGTIPFSVRLIVTPVDATSDDAAAPSQQRAFSMYRGTSGLHTNGTSIGEIEEENLIDPMRYPPLLNAAMRAHESAELQTGMRRVALDASTNTDSDTGSTVFDSSEAPDFLSMIRENLSYCAHCGRRHDRSYEDDEEFCSSFCHTVHHRQSQHEAAADGRPTKQMSLGGGGERKVNFKEAFGKLQLYHIVSVSEIKEEHFDEDDPDSEEEVDQSWRLDLNIERVRSLEDASPKEKVLWILWNKFAHKNYPIPSVYGERYTRYTLELFVLDCRVQIEQLKLRTQLFGFLKAMHIHGLIDSLAVKSVMECLDGKKKRRDIAVSARPELPLDRKTTNNNTRRVRGGTSRRR